MILSFNKPKKKRKTKDHNQTYQSDSGVAGTYVPNMSDSDRKRFKAKHIGGLDERIEIRVSLNHTQTVIKVFREETQDPNVPSWNKHLDVQISMNGKLNLSLEDWSNITLAIDEAKQILKI